MLQTCPSAANSWFAPQVLATFRALG